MKRVQNRNNIGNPYHDEQTGEFTSADKVNSLFGVEGKKESSRNFLPKITSSFSKRRFVEDLSEEEKERLRENFNNVFGNKIRLMNEQNVNPTIMIKDLDRIKSREQWVKDEINEQLNKSQKNKWKKATIVLGLPGSGKSTIAEPLAKMRGSFIIDADEMKKRIPEFQQDENNICKVHEESVDLSNKMMDELMGSGYNMVIGKVGGHAPSIIKLVKALKENGYDIDVIVNDVPFEESINRNIDRYKSGRSNRVVPLSTIFDSDSKIFDTFDQLMEMDEVNGGAIYSNDVLYGQKPQLLKTFKNKEGVLI